MSQLWRLIRTLLGILLRRPLPGVTIVPVLPDGQIVLVRRRDNGLWSLPGGLIDWGEDIRTSAHRELREETGLELIAIQRLIGVYSAPDRDPRMHSVCIALAAEVQGTFRVEDGLEISDVRAFWPGSLPRERLAHDHEQHLRDYFAGATRLA